jgi:hypothetical protein
MGWNFSVDDGFHAIGPRFLKVHAVNMLQNVDPVWRLTHLEPGAAVIEICWRVARQRCAIRGKRPEDGLAVCPIRFDKDIEVFRRARLCVNTHA